MAIANVELSNTFNEFRTRFNDAVTELNTYSSGSGAVDLATIVVDNISVTSSLLGASISANNLNLGRVVVAGASGQLTDDAGLTYNTGTNVLTVSGSVTSPDLAASNLTSGRVVFAGSGGTLSDDSGLSFDNITNALTVTGNLTAGNAELNYITANGLSLSQALSVNITGDVTGNVTGTNVTATNVTAGSLTSGRVVVAGTSGILEDDSGLTYNTTTDSLTVAGGISVGGAASITGNLELSGDLVITGNVSYSNVDVKIIADPLIYLAANNYTSDLVDIGFIGNYNNGVNNEHTGVIRHASTNKMYFFTGYEPEVGSNNIIDVNDASFEPASIVAGNAELNYVTANSLTISDYSLPTSDGSANQILITDGSGNVTFGDLPSSGPSGITTGKAIAMAIVFG